MLLSCGDALIDLLPVKSGDRRDAVVPLVGGSCLNVAVGVARLSAPAGFVGGISSDLFGRMIAEHAQTSQVDLRYTTRRSRPTILAFVRAVDGDAHYAFYDEGTAAQHWKYLQGSMPFAQIDAIHDGSATLVDGRADTVRLSDSDFAFLYGGSGYARKAAALFAAGTGLFVITRRAQGVQAWHRQAGMIEVEAPRVSVVDTVGAGDSFQAGLFALRAIGRVRAAPLARMSADELHHVLGFAAACAAIICGRFGADPPRLSEMGAGLIDTFLGKCSVPG